MNFFKTFLAALLAVFASSIISGFIWIMIFVVAALSMESPATVKNNSLLVIDFNEDITDTPVADPFSQVDFLTLDVHKTLSLYDALCAIDAAKDDDRIAGLYLRMDGPGTVSAASLEELRAAIDEFRAESGKFVVAYSESYSQGQYFLASAADKVYIQPNGGFQWVGMNFNLMFYKGLFDKLGVKAEIFRPTACKYKSAVEPYFLTKMSDENRRQMTDLAESLWGNITEAVAESRGLTVEQLNALADNLAVMLPEEALEAGLVDGMLYESEMDDIFDELGVEANKKGGHNMISLATYASQVTPASLFASEKVGIIYAEGDIADGSGKGLTIYAPQLVEKIREAREDESIKAVVLRVNSPGGSALASDIIWHELELLRAEKPLIVSMGAYAASGGYYISAPADAIVADKMTLTGSIGVFGMMFNAEKLLNDKLGVTFDGVTTNKYSDIGDMSRPMNAAERAAIMRGVDKVYDTFTGLVAEGRKLPIERVLDIAGGRVWSGEEAVAIGLADANGGLREAIAVAADKAALGEDFGIEELVDAPDGLAAIFAAVNASVSERVMRSQLGDAFMQYNKLSEVLSRNGIQAYWPYVLEF